MNHGESRTIFSRAGRFAIREGSTVADQVRSIYHEQWWMPEQALGLDATLKSVAH